MWHKTKFMTTNFVVITYILVAIFDYIFITLFVQYHQLPCCNLQMQKCPDMKSKLHSIEIMVNLVLFAWICGFLGHLKFPSPRVNNIIQILTGPVDLLLNMKRFSRWLQYNVQPKITALWQDCNCESNDWLKWQTFCCDCQCQPIAVSVNELPDVSWRHWSRSIFTAVT